MGGGSYFHDVQTAQNAVGSTRSSAEAFNYSARASSGKVKGMHPDLNVLGKIRECRDSADHPQSTPIVVGMDVTSSRGKDARAIYEQVPSMMAALKLMDIVPDPEILWAAVGDATHDAAPIQIGQFEADTRIDADLSKIWLEEGGGGTGEESYELLAYYLAHRTELDATARKKKGFAFFLGDEAPYSAVDKEQLKNLFGVKVGDNIPTADAFRALEEKFWTFLVFPRSSAEARQAAIDSEIRQRLEAAGGRFREVDIRASLIWDTRDDLDLHCLTPHGEHIYYASKRASCRGELDVDRNVRGEDPKPVENTRWAKGEAPRGKYRFWVELYREWDHGAKEIPFKVELDVDGKIESFSGTMKRGRSGESSAKVAFEFTYAPKPSGKVKKDERADYSDNVVIEKWSHYLDPTRILRVGDAASSVEVMLGAVALQEGGLDLEQFMQSMKNRRVPKERRDDVYAALKAFAANGVVSQVPGEIFR